MARTPKIIGGAATRAGKLTSRLPLIIAELDDKTLEGVKEVAERIADGARERVADAPPIGEGLVDVIHVETEADYGDTTLAVTGTTQAVAVVAGDHDHFYGHILEGGGVHTPAQPFLIPAFEAERHNLDPIIEQLKELE